MPRTISHVEEASPSGATACAGHSSDEFAWWSTTKRGASTGRGNPSWEGPPASTATTPAIDLGSVGLLGSILLNSMPVLDSILEDVLSTWSPVALARGPIIDARTVAEAMVSMSPFLWAMTAIAPSPSEPIHSWNLSPMLSWTIQDPL